MRGGKRGPSEEREGCSGERLHQEEHVAQPRREPPPPAEVEAVEDGEVAEQDDGGLEDVLAPLPARLVRQHVRLPVVEQAARGRVVGRSGGGGVREGPRRQRTRDFGAVLKGSEPKLVGNRLRGDHVAIP